MSKAPRLESMENTMSRLDFFLCAVALCSLVGCGDDGGTTGDTGVGDTGVVDTGVVDTGTPDTSTPDAGMDSGPTDPCASDDATMTVGCNGAILGATQADDALFGGCTPDAEDPRGSCTDADAVCYAYDADLEETARGVCVPPCSPNGSTYVNTSTCPMGTRCFDFGDGEGYCFADCNTAADCVSGQCDGDNSCVGGESTIMDGGVDGGEGGVDGGSDAGEGGVDGGMDAGDAGDAA
jgi:hypothetical protein